MYKTAIDLQNLVCVFQQILHYPLPNLPTANRPPQKKKNISKHQLPRFQYTSSRSAGIRLKRFTAQKKTGTR